ncbi:hypothetical protein CDV55_101870 [Aspergillus turcosus]|nr:hypothetical protein CDV55_101870 [Aspergillus turcosus]
MEHTAQMALRRIIEDYAAFTRFCIITNNIYKLSPALISRCARLRFPPLHPSAIHTLISQVATLEHVQIRPEALEYLSTVSHGDMRQALAVLQECHLSKQASTSTIPAEAMITTETIHEYTHTPLPSDISLIIDEARANSCSRCILSINKIKSENGLNLADILTALATRLQHAQVPAPVKITWLDALAEIEANLACGGSEEIQTAAVVGAIQRGSLPDIMEIPDKQWAQVIESPGSGVIYKQIPVQQPGPDEVLVKIKYSGVCHTDLHAMKGDWPLESKWPLVGGHEGAGIVVAKGELVTNIDIGDHAGVTPRHLSCEFCRRSDEPLCAKALLSGYTVDGTFQQYCVAKAMHVSKIPKDTPLDAVTPILCAGITVYKGLKESGTRPGQTVAIVGAGGGLGSLAQQYAKAMGLRVIAIDSGDEKKAMCLELGAEAFIDFLTSKDLINDVRAATTDRLGPHTALLLAASELPFQQATSYVRPRGTIIAMGMPAHAYLKAPVFNTVVRMINIKGSYVGNRQDGYEALEFFTRGLIHAPFKTVPLSELGEVYKLMDVKTIWAGVSELVEEGSGCRIAIVFRNSTYLLDCVNHELEERVSRAPTELGREIISQLQNYSAKYKEKFVGAGLPESLVLQCPGLCSQLWLKLDIVPLVLRYEARARTAHDRGEVATFWGWERKSPDEQADSMARKCIRSFGIGNVIHTQISHENLVGVDSDFMARLADEQDYERTVEPRSWAIAQQYARDLREKQVKVAFFSLTFHGKPDVHTRHALVRLAHCMGVEFKWYVPKPRPEIHKIVQKMRDILEGLDDPLTYLSFDEELEILEWVYENARRYWLRHHGPLQPRSKGGVDVVVIDSAPLLPLALFSKQQDPGRPVLYENRLMFQNNVAQDPSSPSARVWDFVKTREYHNGENEYSHTDEHWCYEGYLPDDQYNNHQYDDRAIPEEKRNVHYQFYATVATKNSYQRMSYELRDLMATS